MVHNISGPIPLSVHNKCSYSSAALNSSVVGTFVRLDLQGAAGCFGSSVWKGKLSRAFRKQTKMPLGGSGGTKPWAGHLLNTDF